MIEIKNLYDSINLLTIPKVILNELKKNSTQRSFTSVRGKDGKMVTTYGDLMNPMFIHFKQYNFYLNEAYYNDLIENIDLGICIDEFEVKIDRKNIYPFFEEYGKGFEKGYNEFESKIKSNDNLFLVTNEQISHKVYSRIIGAFNNNKGNFSYSVNINKRLEGFKNFIFKKQDFFESGINGGEFYKAWEIILNNPTIYEPIFNKAYQENKTITTEPEAIDLSDTTATEKIIYLHKLGIIDFLRDKKPFVNSINSLATILSAVTGEKSGTIQPMLNTMLSKNVGQKNNPLNSEKPEKKVTKQLNDIGFESK